VQTELVGDLGGVHGVGKILRALDVVIGRRARRSHLLVGKDQEEGITELILAQHALHWGKRPSIAVSTYIPLAPR
jgi:hypothetical protein